MRERSRRAMSTSRLAKARHCRSQGIRPAPVTVLAPRITSARCRRTQWHRSPRDSARIRQGPP